MPGFDQNRFDVDTRRTENPWDSFSGERPDTDAPARRPITDIPLVRIIAIILLAAVLIYLLYSIFVHPINKLKLKLFISKSCTMTIVAQYGLQSAKATVKVDGNIICITDNYYKIEGDKLLAYDYDLKSWINAERVAGEIVDLNDISAYEAILSRRNYKLAKGKFFTWELKDGVDAGGMIDLEFRRKGGRFSFTWFDVYGIKYTLTFTAFGTTHLDPPDKK